MEGPSIPGLPHFILHLTGSDNLELDGCASERATLRVDPVHLRVPNEIALDDLRIIRLREELIPGKLIRLRQLHRVFPDLAEALTEHAPADHCFTYMLFPLVVDQVKSEGAD